MNSENNNRKEMIAQIASLCPHLADQVNAILSCGARFCRVTMKEQPSDYEKRNGARRVFHLNTRASWKRYEAKHIEPRSLTERGIKATSTKLSRGMLNIVENVRPNIGGGSICQCRTLDLSKIDTIKCGSQVYHF